MMMTRDLTVWDFAGCFAVVLAVGFAWAVYAERRDAATDQRRNANMAAWLEVGLTDAEARTLTGDCEQDCQDFCAYPGKFSECAMP